MRIIHHHHEGQIILDHSGNDTQTGIPDQGPMFSRAGIQILERCDVTRACPGVFATRGSDGKVATVTSDPQ